MQSQEVYDLGLAQFQRYSLQLPAFLNLGLYNSIDACVFMYSLLPLAHLSISTRSSDNDWFSDEMLSSLNLRTRWNHLHKCP